ncbi:GreA/GreB family elongation factor [Candidatus Saccharibacteria bacterium]|nr:GreA/GreB family elongation factor [Candidatus Saccharibacteria bacterium]
MSFEQHITSASQITEGTFYCLPHEEVLMHEQIGHVKNKRGVLAGDITEAMEQSSETWHDNAPADALFGEMRVLDLHGTKLAVAKRNLVIVRYPEPDFNQITIGSRVGCIMLGEEFEMDITGNLPIALKSDGDVEKSSIDAPITQALLGALVNSVVEFTVDGRDIEVIVSTLNQTAQHDFYLG